MGTPAIAFRRLLVACDFSDDSAAALQWAIGFAKHLRAEVHVLHAYRLPIEMFSPYGVRLPDSVIPEIRDAATDRLQRELAKVRDAGLRGEAHVREGSPAEAVAEAARALDADLVVMGTRGRTGVAHLVLGSVAAHTVRIAPCPVLTIKTKEG